MSDDTRVNSAPLTGIEKGELARIGANLDKLAAEFRHLAELLGRGLGLGDR